MGRRGPAKVPTAERLARGERRPSQINYQEPEIPPPTSQDPPPGLAGVGLREWQRQIGTLIERGVLTEADLTAFEDYCRALSDLRRYEAKAKRAGLEAAIAKGFTGAVIKLRAQANQLRQQCGLTPSSRTGVKAQKQQTNATTTNPAERYLRAVQGGKRA